MPSWSVAPSGINSATDLSDYVILGQGGMPSRFEERDIIFHYIIYLGNMNQGIPKNPRHIPVHFHDGRFAGTDYGRRIVVVRPEAEITGIVHGRHGNNECFDMNEFGENPWDLVKICRNVVQDFLA